MKAHSVIRRKSGSKSLRRPIRRRVARLNASLDGFLVDVDDMKVVFGQEPVDFNVPIDVSRYTALIAKLSFQYWKRLPEEVRNWIDIEDVMQEGILCAINAAKHWRPERGRPITLIYASVSNMLKNKMLECHYAKKRYAPVVSLDTMKENDEGEERPFDIPDPAHYAEEQEAIKAVERLLEFASDDTRRMLAETLLSPDFENLKGYGRKFLRKAIDEVHSLAKRHGVTSEHLRSVVAMK